jgi:hypothetical protein
MGDELGDDDEESNVPPDVRRSALEAAHASPLNVKAATLSVFVTRMLSSVLLLFVDCFGVRGERFALLSDLRFLPLAAAFLGLSPFFFLSTAFFNVEFHLFLIALSVRPSNNLLITAHLFP